MSTTHEFAIPNHTIHPESGFLESKAYIDAFDTPKKIAFLQRLKQNCLKLYKTADELGISHHTIEKHYRQDPEFRKAYDALEREYADELEGVSRMNALNPKSVIERIFQLKALFPSKYADQRNSGSTVNVAINFDGKLIDLARNRAKAVDAEVMPTDEEKA